MTCIRKSCKYIIALALCLVAQQQYGMDQKSTSQITWTESMRNRLSNLAQRSEDSYADIRRSYAHLGRPLKTNNQQANTSAKK